jgi:hypothetical protein
MRRVVELLVAASVGACATTSGSSESVPAAGDSVVANRQDTTRAGWVPAGFGSLRQDDVALQLEQRDVRVRAIPLDETVIRLLSPDSYTSLREARESRRSELDRLATVHQLRERNVWIVTFHGLAAEARFNPNDLTVRSAGREFRPLEILALTAGFGEHRLQPRDSQQALVLFEDGIDLSQPLSLTFGTARDVSGWEEVLRVLERERALVRSRAATGGRAP